MVLGTADARPAGGNSRLERRPAVYSEPVGRMEQHVLSSGTGPSPVLIGLDRVDASSDPAAVALVLHGGRTQSFEPVRRGNLAALRMRVLADAMRKDGSVPVLALRYRYRGWNDADGTRTPDSVRDALTALELIEQRLGPVPVILIGHSLGGRTAVRVASYPTVRAVAALAPWLPDGEPVDPLAGRSVLIAHGRRDRVTDIGHSISFAKRAIGIADAVYLKLLDDGHAMLRAAPAWHRLSRGFAAMAAHGTQAGALDADRLDLA